MSHTVKAPLDLRSLLATMKSAKEQSVHMAIWDRDIKAVEDAITTIEVFRSGVPAQGCAKCGELDGVLDRADAHTEMLMRSIKNLETKLKAAEYAARVNWDGWQQELGRTGSAPSSTNEPAQQTGMPWERAETAEIEHTAFYLVKDNGDEWRDFDLHVMHGRIVQRKLDPNYVRGRPVWIAKINSPAFPSTELCSPGGEK